MKCFYDKMILGDSMNKAHYIEELFDDLKDEIEFDEDVIAVFKILKAMIKIDIKKGVENYLYLMSHYSFKDLAQEINIIPLTKYFLIELLKYQKIEDILKLLEEIPLDNRILIESNLINTFTTKSGIYQYFKTIITKKETKKEIKEIELILKINTFSPLYFDKVAFLKNIILIHLKTKNIDLPILLKIANYPKHNKDRALLKSLFIDYI